jgi:hypothetical protein
MHHVHVMSATVVTAVQMLAAVFDKHTDCCCCSSTQCLVHLRGLQYPYVYTKPPEYSI